MSGDHDVSGLRRDVPASSAPIPMPRRSALTRVALPVGAVALFAAVLLYAARDALAPKLPVRVVPVVVKASAAGGSVVGQAAGWVEPDPYPVHVQALTDGVVAEVHVLEGQVVEKDQVVARLVPDDARIALARAEAASASARADVAIETARLEGARTEWENPVERRRAVAVAEAGLAAARAEVAAATREAEAEAARSAEAQERLRRAESDLANGTLPEREVAQVRHAAASMAASAMGSVAKREAAEANLRTASAELTAAQEGLRLRIEEKRALSEAEASLAKARADADAAEADRAEAALRVARLEVRSPAAGVVMERLVEPGFFLPVGDVGGPARMHVVSLYDPAKLQVRADVPLAHAAGVGVGQKARIVVEVLPDRAFDGEVTRVVHTADIQKNTLQVKVAIRDPAPELKPEMLARVQFLAREGGAAREAQRVFAPERLLAKSHHTEATAWVVGDGRTAERRSVTLGTSVLDGWIEVVSGLRPGDELIDADAATLREGQRLEVLGESTGGRP